MINKEYKGIIFDIDGTLLDSLDFWADADRQFLKNLGIAYDPSISTVLKTMHFTSASEYFVEKYNLDLTAEQVMESILGIVKENYFNKLCTKPFVKEYIEQENNKGIKMCAATSNLKYLAEGALKNAGIYDKMQFILTSDEVKCGKESPLIFHKSAEMLGLDKDEIIVFEDSVHAAESASKAGFYTIGIYDRHYEDEFRLLEGIADITVKSFEELLMN